MPRNLHQIFLILLLYFLNTHVEICNGLSDSVKLETMVKRVSSEKIGEVEMDEMMDSESNRRVLLMGRRYISYDTLRRDMVPCDRPGASYYNCKGPGEANFYRRGCEVITNCARGGA